jgi:CO dehydrogenase/acetyl-CoA synthase epsilon subunit
MLSSISEKGEKQKRSINIIEGEENATSVMIDSVEKAERYIFCVGGRSRNQAYLDALSQRVKQGDIRYIRIITGDHIRHQLCEHIRSIFQNIELGYLKEDKYGGIIATHDTVILALYSSRVPNLEKTLKINDEQIASDYRAYIQDLLNASEKPLDMNFILSLCTACRVNLKI